MLPFFFFCFFSLFFSRPRLELATVLSSLFGLAANTLNVRNNNNNNNNSNNNNNNNNNDNNNTARCDDCTYIHTYAFGLQATHKPAL